MMTMAIQSSAERRLTHGEARGGPRTFVYLHFILTPVNVNIILDTSIIKQSFHKSFHITNLSIAATCPCLCVILPVSLALPRGAAVLKHPSRLHPSLSQLLKNRNKRRSLPKCVEAVQRLSCYRSMRAPPHSTQGGIKSMQGLQRYRTWSDTRGHAGLIPVKAQCMLGGRVEGHCTL